MAGTNRTITLNGNAIAVRGEEVREGELFPSFCLTGVDMKDVTNQEVQGKVAVFLTVPSLDTPVCSVEAKKFNDEVCSLSEKVAVVVVSRDLPFAQKRWCGAEGATRVKTASDYKLRTFGEATGTDWSDAGLLARAVFVTDTTGKVRYVEYVPEIAQEPNYEAAKAAVKALC